MRVLGLDHVGIDVTDLDRSVRFYSEVLGLVVRRRIGTEQVLLDCHGVSLALFRKAELPRRDLGDLEHPGARAHHAFRVSGHDFRRAKADLEARGLATNGPINWGDHDCLYFLDPDGNLLEIIEEH